VVPQSRAEGAAILIRHEVVAFSAARLDISRPVNGLVRSLLYTAAVCDACHALTTYRPGTYLLGRSTADIVTNPSDNLVRAAFGEESADLPRVLPAHPADKRLSSPV